MKMFSLQLSVVAIAVLSLASVASAAVPNDASFKARGMKNAAPQVRYYSYSTPAPVAGRQSFSYAPTGNAAEAAPAAKATANPAPIAQQPRSYRTYSYAPVQNNYRSYRAHRRTGLAGDYASRADLYK